VSALDRSEAGRTLLGGLNYARGGGSRTNEDNERYSKTIAKCHGEGGTGSFWRRNYYPEGFEYGSVAGNNHRHSLATKVGYLTCLHKSSIKPSQPVARLSTGERSG